MKLPTSDAIRDRINFAELLRSYGITLDGRGRGKCPFSDRHTNSDEIPPPSDDNFSFYMSHLWVNNTGRRL
jgi:hypothetical protein